MAEAVGETAAAVGEDERAALLAQGIPSAPCACSSAYPCPRLGWMRIFAD